MIRPATSDDRAEWVRMRCALWPECSPERHALEIQQLVSPAGGGIVLVAETGNGSLCGFAEVSVRRDHVDGASSVPIAYLEGWYVNPEFRARGIGRALLNAVEQWAAAHGFTELASDAELDNNSSIRTHVACGFTETCRAVHFIKRIEGTARPP